MGMAAEKHLHSTRKHLPVIWIQTEKNMNGHERILLLSDSNDFSGGQNSGWRGSSYTPSGKDSLISTYPMVGTHTNTIVLSL